MQLYYHLFQANWLVKLNQNGSEEDTLLFLKSELH